MKKGYIVLFVIIFICSIWPKKDSGNNDTENNDTVEESVETFGDTNDDVVLQSLDLIGNIKVVFGGWNGFGEVIEIDTSECSSFIQENISFCVQTESKTLSIGDTCVIIAVYDENTLAEAGYRVLRDSKEFTVSGLREISDAELYSDGVAWIQVETNNKYNWCCCDKEGNILFELEGGSPTTSFVNGVAIVSGDKIVNKEGEIVWSVDEDGVNKGDELWGADNVISVEMAYEETNLEYFTITFKIDTFQYSGFMIGKIDNQGEWIMEPMEQELYEEAVAEMDETDQDNGLIFIKDEDSTYYTGFFCNENGEVVIDLAKYTLEASPIFYDGYAIIEFEEDGNIYCVAIDETGQEMFGPIQGSIGRFYDGYAFLKLTNEQGSAYYTIINTKGEQMFEPKKWSIGENYEINCGYYWVSGEGFLNVYGETEFSVEEYGFEEYDDTMGGSNQFVEDMSIVVIRNEKGAYILHYMNTEGEIVY